MRPSAERVRELLDYDKSTGLFTWRDASRVRGSAVAGCVHRGRVSLCVDYHQAGAHQYAWLYHYGVWPTHGIDHINGVATDNRIVNLRDVPQGTNVENQRRPRSNNTSGYLGVTWHKKTKKWRAKIGVKGRYITILYTDDPEKAHAAYIEAKRRLHAGSTI